MSPSQSSSHSKRLAQVTGIPRVPPTPYLRVLHPQTSAGAGRRSAGRPRVRSRLAGPQDYHSALFGTAGEPRGEAEELPAGEERSRPAPATRLSVRETNDSPDIC